MAGNQGIPVIGPALNKIIGTRNERFVKKYTSKVDQINALADQMSGLTDSELKSRFRSYRKRIEGGEKAEAMLPEVFAIAREAMDRSVGIRNTLNPEHEFDASRLPADMQQMHADLMKQASELPVLLPKTFMGEAPQGAVADERDEFLGSTEPIPGWVRVEIPPAFYAAVRELIPESRPPFRTRPFDVQLLGAMVLSQGKIAEMKTGEGKTIVAPLATCLAGVEGLKIHVVTVNDYLVQRDRDWTFPFFHALGHDGGGHPPPAHAARGDQAADVPLRRGVRHDQRVRVRLPARQHEAVGGRAGAARREFAIVDEVDSIADRRGADAADHLRARARGRPRYEQADELARHLVELHKPWHAGREKVQACNQRIKGLEGDIRQTARRARKTCPEQKQAELAESARSCPSWRGARPHTQYYEIKLERQAART